MSYKKATSETTSDYKTESPAIPDATGGSDTYSDSQGEEARKDITYIYDGIMSERDSNITKKTIEKSALSDYIGEQISQELESKLNDPRYLEKSTALMAETNRTESQTVEKEIQNILEDHYDISEDSIRELNKFKEKTIKFHKHNVERRKKWRITEAIASATAGIGIVLVTFGARSVISGMLPVMLAPLIIVLLFVFGISLALAGISGLVKEKLLN